MGIYGLFPYLFSLNGRIGGLVDLAAEMPGSRPHRTRCCVRSKLSKSLTAVADRYPDDKMGEWLSCRNFFNILPYEWLIILFPGCSACVGQDHCAILFK